MFRSRVQSGPCVDVFSASGRDPTAEWKVTPSVRRELDLELRKDVYVIGSSGGSGRARMQCPKSPSLKLGLEQPCLVFHVLVHDGSPFTIDLTLADASMERRRINFSTSTKATRSDTPLHAKVALSDLERGQWLELVLDVGDLCRGCFGEAHELNSIDEISVGSSCRLRRVFTLRSAATEVPPKLCLPPGTPHTRQVIAFQHDGQEGSPRKMPRVLGGPAPSGDPPSGRQAKTSRLRQRPRAALPPRRAKTAGAAIRTAPDSGLLVAGSATVGQPPAGSPEPARVRRAASASAISTVGLFTFAGLPPRTPPSRSNPDAAADDAADPFPSPSPPRQKRYTSASVLRRRRRQASAAAAPTSPESGLSAADSDAAVGRGSPGPEDDPGDGGLASAAFAVADDDFLADDSWRFGSDDEDQHSPPTAASPARGGGGRAPMASAAARQSESAHSPAVSVRARQGGRASPGSDAPPRLSVHRLGVRPVSKLSLSLDTVFSESGNSDMSSFPGTPVPKVALDYHASETLKREGTSALLDSFSAERPFSPPIALPSVRRAMSTAEEPSDHTQPLGIDSRGDDDSPTTAAVGEGETEREGERDRGGGSPPRDEVLELLYDNMLHCYFDPRTNQYYELA